jgi:sulfide:quinone oxidoreductase
VPIDAVIAQPTLRGPEIEGLPHDGDGFLPIDEHARVRDLEHVYAAGDAVVSPIKQGGLAAQQADAAAAQIAAELGADVEPRALDPVLRGLLLTGAAGSMPRFLRTHLGVRELGVDGVSSDPLWWPPAKIAALHLAPYLADRLVRRSD